MTWVTLTAPFALKQGSTYACTVNQPFFIPDSTVIDAFTAQGFTSVARDTSDHAEARYTGVWGQADQDGVPMPDHVKTVIVWVP